MKRFRFPLERLQRLRAHQERIARRELARHMTILNEVEAEIAVTESNLSVCHDDDRRPHSLGEAMAAGIESVRRRLAERRAQAEELVEAARTAYVERRRDHEALSRMRDRQFETWRVEATRAEQHEMDELARLRFAGEGGER